MKRKKLLALTMTAAMGMSMAACGGESDSAESSGDVYKIGICQQLEHDALDQATQGFEDACKEKFGEDKVEFDKQNARASRLCAAPLSIILSLRMWI